VVEYPLNVNIIINQKLVLVNLNIIINQTLLVSGQTGWSNYRMND